MKTKSFSLVLMKKDKSRDRTKTKSFDEVLMKEKRPQLPEARFKNDDEAQKRYNAI
jgi:hypothetical protein